MCTPMPTTLSQTSAVLYSQQSTTSKGQGFPLPAPTQAIPSRGPPTSLMGTRPIWKNAPHGPFDFLLFQDPVRHVYRIY